MDTIDQNETNELPSAVISALKDAELPSIEAKYKNERLMQEADVMCQYAMANGLEVPAMLITQGTIIGAEHDKGLNTTQLANLASIHQQLNAIVSPATPQALLLMDDQKKKHPMLHIIGIVPIIRQIVIISLVFIVSFILIGQLEVVDEKNLQLGILGNHGAVAVAILGYLVCCAGLGACFTALFRLNSYVSEATYDPRYDSTYWTSILLGIIAGLFISELLYLTFVSGAETDSHNLMDLGKPALALLGGFSANMVYKVLQRLVETVESLFKGNQGSIVKAKRETDISQLKQKQGEIHMNVASRLLDLDKQLVDAPESAKSTLRNTINELLGKNHMP